MLYITLFLKNEETSANLLHLVKQAEEFNAKNSDYDIVKEYLQLSGNCEEILQFVKKLNEADSQKAELLLKALCHLLIRIASTLHVYVSAGTSIVNEVLAYGMKTIFGFIKMKQKSARTKLALHLLASMIALGNQTADQVVTKLDFSNVSFTHLFNRTNISEDEDVRTAFLNLLVLILSMCSSNVIRQMIEVKGFLNQVFPGLLSDHVSTILLVLNTFQSKIIDNPNIPKTTKIRLFNDRSLRPVVQLYSWKGPLKTKNPRKRKLGEDDAPSVAFEVSEEEAIEVHKCAHEFMLSLCSYQNGIIFQDPMLAISGKNLNIVITHILKAFPKPFYDTLMSEFVISTLKACPDQLKLYLTFVKESFTPRLSPRWLDAINFLERVMYSQDTVSILFISETKRSVPTLLSIAKIFCLLDVFTATEIVEVIAHGHHVLSYYMCCFLSHVLKRVKEVLNFTTNPNSSDTPYNASDFKAFRQEFLPMVHQSFPILSDIQNCYRKVTSNNVEKLDEDVLKDLPVPTLAEELSKFLELLKCLQFLAIESKLEVDIDVPHLFSGLNECGSLLPSGDVSNIYVSIVELLSSQDSLSLWTKKSSESPLLVIADVYKMALKAKNVLNAKDIVHKILLQTKIFDGCLWELDIWLECLEGGKSKHIAHVFEFISEAVHTLLQHPGRFTTDDALNSKPEFMDVEDCLRGEKCFSSFVPAVLYTLQNLEKKGCQLFVEKALIPIIHHQHHPEKLFRVIKKYQSALSSSLFAYLEMLSFPKHHVQDKIQSILDFCNMDLSGHLRRNFVATHSSNSTVEICSCSMSNLLNESSLSSIRKVIWQTLTYINFETTLISTQGATDAPVLSYISLLEQLSTFVCKDSDGSTEAEKGEPSVFEIMNEMLNHPVMIRMFLGILPPTDSYKQLNDSISAATKLVLNIAQRQVKLEQKSRCPCLIPFKNKVVDCMKMGLNTSNLNGVEFETVLGQFSSLFSSSDIVLLLERLLSSECVSSDFASLLLLLEFHQETNDFMLLSSKCINSLFKRFVSMPKKQKKVLRKHILHLLNRHPTYALLITEETSCVLLQDRSSKDLDILGTLINTSVKFRQVLQHAMMEDQSCDDFIYLASKCIVNCVPENVEDTDFKKSVSSSFWKAFAEALLNDSFGNDKGIVNTDAGKAAGLILFETYSSPKRLNEFCEKLLEQKTPNLSKILVLLQVFETWKLFEKECPKTKALLLRVTFLWMIPLLSEDFCCWELTTFIRELLKSKKEDVELSEVMNVDNFCSKSLKLCLKYEEIGNHVLPILVLMCEKLKDRNLPLQSVFGLLIGHSNFFQIMLPETNEESSIKEYVIDLLTILVQADSTLCKENHFGLFLSSYGATMTTVDQKLLFLMKLYADKNIDMTKYSPFLWGKPAIGHYSVLSSNQMYLWKQPKLQDVLSLFLPENIECTSLNYPLAAELHPSSEVVEVDKTLADKMYDLRFMLPLFANVLSPGSYVHCSKFTESKVLMLIFSSLSSLDPNMRAAGYYCLTQFHQHLEGANFRNKDIWLCLLDSVRNSIGSPNPKVPSIISLFLARASDMFTKPDHKLYTVIYKFITVKPFLDIGQVPEFYKLFNSIELEHRIQKLWLLDLIGDGLRSSLDFHICEKRYIFPLLQHYYLTSLPTSQEKVAILHIINSAVKVPSTCRTLCENGLLLWLQGAIGQGDLEVSKNLCSVLESLQKNVKEQFIFQYSNLLWSFLPCIKSATPDIVKNYLANLLNTLTFTKTMDKESVPVVSLQNITQLNQLCQTLKEKLKCNENDETGKVSLYDTTIIKDSVHIFSQIMTHWEPLLKEDVPNNLYRASLTIIVSLVETVLQSYNDSPFYYEDFPVWLLGCVTVDEKRELGKLLLAKENENSLKLILELFEKSIVLSNSRKDCSGEMCSNKWKSLLLHLNSIIDGVDGCSTGQLFQQMAQMI